MSRQDEYRRDGNLEEKFGNFFCRKELTLKTAAWLDKGSQPPTKRPHRVSQAEGSGKRWTFDTKARIGGEFPIFRPPVLRIPCCAYLLVRPSQDKQLLVFR